MPITPETIQRAYAGQIWPDEQLRIFSAGEKWFATRRIRAAENSSTLPDATATFDDFSFQAGEKRFDLYDYVFANRVVGLLVLHDGNIRLEHYALGFDQEQRWLSMSMAKSISTTLVGVALKEGAFSSLNDPLVTYLPELEGGGYDNVNIEQLLRMSSGVQWNETYTDPSSDRRHMLKLQIAESPGSIVNFMSSLPGIAPPGTVWNYSTGETHLVGALLKAATGIWPADYLSEHIWSRIGMEQDAEWWLESPGGLEVAGSGICATLRDYARFGHFLAGGGVINGRHVLPENWLSLAGQGRDHIPYGFMWWPVPEVEGAFAARGIFGQRMYIHPQENVVAVILSSRSKPLHAEVVDDNLFFASLMDHLIP